MKIDDTKIRCEDINWAYQDRIQCHAVLMNVYISSLKTVICILQACWCVTVFVVTCEGQGREFWSRMKPRTGSATWSSLSRL